MRDCHAPLCALIPHVSSAQAKPLNGLGPVGRAKVMIFAQAAPVFDSEKAQRRPSCPRRFLNFCDQVLEGGPNSRLMLGQINRSLPQAGEVSIRKILWRIG